MQRRSRRLSQQRRNCASGAGTGGVAAPVPAPLFDENGKNMIDKTLNFLAAELNGFLGARFPSKEEHAVVAGLSASDGTSAAKIENRLVLSLVNIERETAASAIGITARSDGSYARYQPPLHLNLYVLVSASFNSNYGQALQFLGIALGFFQARTNFDALSGAGFPPELDRLSVEIVSLSIQELNNLWAILGTKYLPSALYKVRMLTLQENWMAGAVPAIADAGVTMER